MTIDYKAIKDENIKRYGTDIERIGPMLLSDRYADSAHFIYELLQNAEDAIGRRENWKGSKTVSFNLSKGQLRVSHYGVPFTEPDVKGICGIGEGTKDITEIGEFGIGFKSVYEITNRPEIHSGEEDFAIESYVRPIAAEPISREFDETVILLPLKDDDTKTIKMITSGLTRLSLSALRFLRNIDAISWSVDGIGSGIFLRESKVLGKNIRRVELLGQSPDSDDIQESWLIFSKPIRNMNKDLVGYVEIAFTLSGDREKDIDTIGRVERSPLVAFFPTALETNLGFLIQGPYRTTPSRDNVPSEKPWNQKLVSETATLLIESLKWLRKEKMLDINVLKCLPINSYKFDEENMFYPIFQATKTALLSLPLLPKLPSGFTSARGSFLGRTQDLRELVNSKQLTVLSGESEKTYWLSGEITINRTPNLRTYLIEELGIQELTPALLIDLLTEDFFDLQTDAWIRKFYEFLNNLPDQHKRLGNIPFLRLENGEHTEFSSAINDTVFLPGKFKTDFPTVHHNVCNTEASHEFLVTIGLHEPDPVDDVILNLLPNYEADDMEIDEDDYAADINRILEAYETDSKSQRDRLIKNLKSTSFVMAVEGASGEGWRTTPDNVYIATDRLYKLFEGVEDVFLIDRNYECLRGEMIRELLEACGAVRYLKPVRNEILDWVTRKEIRAETGHPGSSGRNDVIVDWNIKGVDELLETLPQLDSDQVVQKARLLWEELVQLEERRGKSIFTGKYTWTDYGSYEANFDSSFVKQLNEIEWIPDGNGALSTPELILFSTLGWKPHPFLQAKIKFKPPILDSLAHEAGIDPDVLDLLKRLNLTNVEELRSRLGVEENDEHDDENNGSSDDTPEPSPGTEDSDDNTTGSGGGQSGRRGDSGSGSKGASGGGGYKGRKGSAGGKGRSQFVSYVSVHPDDESDHDPDGLTQKTRLELEEKAIQFILKAEPRLSRTHLNNPGFDLFESDSDNYIIKWVEVKAMTRGLENRPVGLSHTQFKCALEHGDDFWLYIVENVENEAINIVRIQDPAGKARTFTFDRGWKEIAE